MEKENDSVKGLLNALTRLGPSKINARLESVSGLSLTKRLLLTFLLENRENADSEWKGVTMSLLAEKIGVSKPAVTKIVDELEQGGFVERRYDRNDRRNVYVVFSETGENKVKEIWKKLKALLSELIAKIGEKDVKAFIDLTDRFYSTLCECSIGE